MSSGNKPLDKAYFERKKNPKYSKEEKLTECCKQNRYHNHMMRNNDEDWKLIEEYIEDKLSEYPNTISITPIFCDVCDRFLEYKAEIDVNQTLGYRSKNG